MAGDARLTVLGSAISKGRIQGMDISAAKAASGVLAVVTAENAGKLGKGKLNAANLLGGPDIQHYRQAIELVVAESFEQARAAVALIRVDYAKTPGSYDLAAVKDTGKPAAITGGPGNCRVGDFEAAFASAAVKLDETYTTPDEAHAMMEPHGTTATWSGDTRTVWTSNQMVE